VRPERELLDDGFVAAQEQFILGGVVEVEGSPSHVGPIDNVLDRHGIVALLPDQAYQGLLQQLAGALDASVGLGHRILLCERPSA
jgi:hypothetical protein